MRAVVLSLSASGAAVLAAAWACLPDLQISAAAPFCGDGIIDPDAETCDPGADSGGNGVGCARCKVTCGETSPFQDDVSHHCYFARSIESPATTDTVSSSAAVASCENDGAHVVRFVSANEVALVASSAASAPFWVGIDEPQAGSAWLPFETTPEPGWSPLCTGCFANVPAGATQIPVGGAQKESGFCVVGWSDVEPWSQSLCSGVSRYTICEREPAGTRVRPCSRGDCFTVAATQATKRYVLLPSQRLLASDAVQACTRNGGRLVVFQSREEREQVGHELAPLAADFWIGMASDTYGRWAWDMDAGLEPLPWGAQQPSLEAGARAYVQIAPGVIDSELARAGNASDAGAEQHYAVCEISD